MQARPRRLPVCARSTDDAGDLHLTVEFERRGWQCWLGAPAQATREFVLDRVGRQVYELCDGKRTVEDVVRRIGGDLHLSPGEAEQAVTTYLKTLMSRCLVAVTVPAEEEA